MSPDALFPICNALVLPGWLLLIVAPRWRWTDRLVASCALTLILAGAYAYLIVAYFGRSEGGFGSLAQVALAFKSPHVLLAGWIHYLAFDLFVGGWEARDARKLGIPHALLVPCLLLTFVFGPMGLLAYFLLRWTLRRRVLVGEMRDGR